MAHETLPGEQTGQLEALLERWQTSLDLHAKYAALDDARYWHVQPWPKHERPQRWIIQLARKRILALKRIVTQRQSEGDRAFIEGIEIMGFLATLVGLTSVERFIPLATHETERRDVLTRQARGRGRQSGRGHQPLAHAARRARDHVAHRREPPRVEAAPGPANTGAPPRPRARCRRCRTPRSTACSPRNAPACRSRSRRRRAAPKREARRDPARPATVKPKKAPATVTQTEHVVIADAVRLLGWGKQWHELAEMIARLAERPSPSEIRRILRTYRDQIDAVATRRRD